MPLPISGSRFDRIGKKLAEGTVLSGEEAAELELVFTSYDSARQVVQDGLSALGHPPSTSRLKTTTTLIDKLQREPLSIRGIDDLAGVRLIIDGGRFKQDRLGEIIRQKFDNADKPPKIHDRRYGPSFGYRAVHIIVYVDKIPVEVQLRTELQHMWAEITEKLGDKWGRGLRYGNGPDSPDAEIAPGITRGDLFVVILALADLIDKFETGAHQTSIADHQLKKLDLAPARDRRYKDQIRKLRDQVSAGHAQLVSVEEELRVLLRKFLFTCELLEG